MNTPSDLARKVQNLPPVPGVYLMKGKGNDFLYIGKALNLRKRVASYFQSRKHAPKISVLVSKIQDVDVIETPSEADALLLEAALVKRYQPRYNTELRDDKSFPLLKITNERFPRLHVSRHRNDRKATYYGPYTDAKLLHEVVRIINGLFPIRKCRRLPKSACLYYRIGQCVAPCIKPEVKPRHDRYIREIKAFLGGGKKSLMDYLTDRMHAARHAYQFEDAQFYKEQIKALGWIRKKRFHMKYPEAGIGLSGTLELKKLLGLERLPERIVCFDVSNIQGDRAVASKVCFMRELEHKLEYRRYKVKTVTGINDYAMIQEALGRMLRGIREGKEPATPDLILIDGGKGHLRAAMRVLEREGFSEVPVLAIAKQFEYLFSPKTEREIVLPDASPALRLLKRIRDEAHRFAITYHRSLKVKDLTQSVLDQIPGIGARRKRVLLSHFNSIDELKKSNIEEFSKLPGMNSAVAKRMHELFSKIPQAGG